MHVFYTYLFLTDFKQDWFLAILRFILILFVIFHVLRHVRDTRAAIGWIGFSLIMPIIGFILYVMFGVNRVVRRAQKLVNNRPWHNKLLNNMTRYYIKGHFYPLAKVVEGFTQRPLLMGNDVEPLFNGDQAYPVMLESIHSAKVCVFLSSYILRSDETGKIFADALIAAQQRGVIVRVLVDGIGSGYFYCPIAKYLEKNGVRIDRFMHSFLPWKMPFINLRTHKKILVVDGKIGFLGGLNIAGENILANHPKNPVSDTHFKITGTIVHELTEAFLQDWFFITAEDLNKKSFYPPVETKGNMICRIITAGPDTDMEKIKYTMMQAISLARESIRIMTPYFLPDDRFLSLLCLAAVRGVNVEIVIPEQSNQILVDWARNINNILPLQFGCKIWLVKAPFNHSKLMVIDRIWSFVGSSNVDMRSLRLNFEINMEIYHKEFAQQIDDFIGSHRHRLLTLEELKNRSSLAKFRDSTTRLLLPYL
ncbi:Phosphatidylserine/phosphatidylglycerophosphate/cardiolipin synthase (Cls) (PDB:1BYR) [Commensalibacter communis]|uniref:cardiolipin synthase n=1 Tax=Commensalibacter communis TaxID=2972786 RepID=UPI0022FF9EDC|nr:cardiolipin synthase [Commensalibacter communis]CAI3923233.1 Phosphatidylserine/phosphatidylglycerophosphate/cardiolipin synthase (Cls) (PDB:1BYR) [Commensalibacter communis]CAI3935923.1 Phosphatidylserine/phosphatidylglycerophosphate/cardiolipin synthase (Cls) (PDB:1BYR) [Commensalibacter communis]